MVLECPTGCGVMRQYYGEKCPICAEDLWKGIQKNSMSV